MAGKWMSGVPTKKSALIEGVELVGRRWRNTSLPLSLRGCLQTRVTLYAENLALRHQLLLLQRLSQVACDGDLATDFSGFDSPEFGSIGALLCAL